VTRRHAILDVQGLSVINLILGIRGAADQLGRDDLWQQMETALRTGTAATGSPMGPVLDFVESLRPGIDFERRAEGARVTPDWWLRHMVARRLYRTLDEAINKATTAIERDIVVPAEEAKDPVAVGILTSRGFEAIDKLRTHVPEIEATLARLADMRGARDDLWPARVSGDVIPRAGVLLDRCLDAHARSLPGLANLPPGDEPDFFGQGYYTLVDQCFRSLVTEQSDRFVRFFPPMFQAGLMAFERVRAGLVSGQEDPERAAILISGPLVDLLDISGYALISGEMGATTAWNTCRLTWDSYFDAREDATAIAGAIVSLMDAREFPGILPGDLLRTSRWQQFGHFLRSKLRLRRDAEPLRRRPVHPSHIVRVAARPFGLDVSVGLFIATYLAPRLPAGSTLPLRAKRVADELAFQEERDNARAKGKSAEDLDADDGDGFDIDEFEDFDDEDEA
jgi:hypothetical protein